MLYRPGQLDYKRSEIIFELISPKIAITIMHLNCFELISPPCVLVVVFSNGSLLSSLFGPGHPPRVRLAHYNYNYIVELFWS